jgi:hypothetical protein
MKFDLIINAILDDNSHKLAIKYINSVINTQVDSNVKTLNSLLS